MKPTLSDEAWALLGMLYRTHRGGPTPQGFKDAFKELRAQGLVDGNAITEKGDAALRDKETSDDMTLPPRVPRPPKP